MWIIAKYKQNELEILKKNISKMIGKEVKYYVPKIKIKKLNSKNKFSEIKKNILEDYMFLYDISFQDTKFIKSLKNVRGLKYFLNNCKETQEEINFFINNCSKNEVDGYLNQNFFNQSLKDKAVFVSGPLTGMMFDIIKKQGKKIKALIGNFETTISEHQDYLYKPI